MTRRVLDLSPRTAARAAAVSMPIMAVAATLVPDGVLGRLVVDGDAATTVANIGEGEWLFRAGIFGLLVVLVCDLLVAWGLYVYLRPVHSGLALLLAACAGYIIIHAGGLLRAGSAVWLLFRGGVHPGTARPGG